MAGLTERHPRLAMNALRFVSARLHDLQVQYRQLATERVERRIARALLRLVQQAGRRIESGVLIDLPLSREDVAQMTGTTLCTVSRTISRFGADGVLETGRQRMVVRNPHRLRAIATISACRRSPVLRRHKDERTPARDHRPVEPSRLSDMLVADVLAMSPAATRGFLDRGMACVGCPFAPFETLAEAAAACGVDAFELATAIAWPGPADARMKK